VALPGGVALTLLAVMLRSTPPDKSAPADTPAVALEPVPSLADALAVIPLPPLTSLHLRSSKRTPSWITRKCHPHRLP
jgi:hypothetical protein